MPAKRRVNANPTTYNANNHSQQPIHLVIARRAATKQSIFFAVFSNSKDGWSEHPPKRVDAEPIDDCNGAQQSDGLRPRPPSREGPSPILRD